jgi:Bacterial Ig-like domain (group 3)
MKVLRPRLRIEIWLCLLAGCIATCAAPAVAEAAPPSGGKPSVSGTAQQGNTLTLTQGTWNNAPTAVTDQWQDCNNRGANCTPISGATGSTYVLGPGDVGHTIVVLETATNADGTRTARSAPTAVVLAARPPVNATPPTITGTPQQGQTLTASAGTWSNRPTSFAFQWERCTITCAAIPGATGSTYVLAAADVGATIEVQVTATNASGSTSATSLPTSAVTPPPPAPTSAPSITGTFRQGSVLTEHHGGWTNNPTSFAFQWIRCDGAGANCAPISGATAQTYTLTAADVGARLVVLEQATNAGGTSPAFSALTDTITTPANVIPVPSVTSPPKLSGIAQQGQTLHESHGTWTFNPSAFRYQWARCQGASCTDIPGATAQSYTLTGADVGQTIIVSETAVNDGGASQPAASARSGVVRTTSKVSLVVSPAALVAGQPTTLVATISSASANATPSGSVTFLNGLRAIGGCSNQPVNASAQSATVVCQASFAAGTKQLTATYQPASGSLVNGSTSAPQTIIVSQDSTSISLQAVKRVKIHKRATLTATVISPVGNSGPIVPTGSIEFFDNGHPISGCKSRAVRNSTASCTVAYRSRGRHRISARYGGDSNFRPSTSPSRILTVVRKNSKSPMHGSVTAILLWKFFYHPSYTQVLTLRATGITNGMTLRLACQGSGCPFTRRATTERASCAGATGGTCSTSPSIDLLSRFRHRHLGVGTQITITITRRNWVGKYYSFTMMAGHAPDIALSCLAPGSSRPGIGC